MRFLKKPVIKNSNIGGYNDSCQYLSKVMSKNLEMLEREFGRNSDLIVSNFLSYDQNDIVYVYLKDIADKDIVNKLLVELTGLEYESKKENMDIRFDILKSYLSSFSVAKSGDEFRQLCEILLIGGIVFLIDGEERFYSIAASSDRGRSIAEPTSQTIVRGPKDAFTENIDINVMLIRKRIRNTSLKVKDLVAGSVTHTAIKMIYIKGLARDDIVIELEKRIENIDYDSILDSGYIEEMIKDDKYSIFPAFLNSEKPDAVVAAILEGRIAIIVDGTPYVLTAPALFIEFLQASEDYYHHFILSSVIRLIRFIAFFMTILIPALFISVANFSQELLPTPLLISLAAQREGVPFPVFLQVLAMEVIFEILREAGIRMPRAIGPAISIVGALVLGQAAVDAGLISASVVIVVSITAISNFAIPNYEMAYAARILRFGFIVLAFIYGLYGVLIGLIILTLHLSKLKSLTVPYLSSFALGMSGTLQDTLIRSPFWSMKKRPAGISSAKWPRTSGHTPVGREQEKKPESV